MSNINRKDRMIMKFRDKGEVITKEIERWELNFIHIDDRKLISITLIESVQD